MRQIREELQQELEQLAALNEQSEFPTGSEKLITRISTALEAE